MNIPVPIFVVTGFTTDRPKSVRNRCVIEVFGGVFVLSRCILDFSVGVGAFVIGLSQISSFFTQCIYIVVSHFIYVKFFFMMCSVLC